MVTWMGTWIPEENYDNYPEEKMCDKDRLYIGLKKMYPDYVPETSWDFLLEVVLSFFAEDWEDDGYDNDSIENCLNYVYEHNGLYDFDYE